MSKKVEPNLQLFVDVLKTGDCIDHVVTRTLKPYNITHVQYNILRILKGAYPEPLYVGELKNRLLFTNSDITRLLDRLIKKGLIERQICTKNRRRVEVLITKDGTRLLSESTEEIERALKFFLKQDISETEAMHTSSVLEHIRKKIFNFKNHEQIN